MDKDFKVGSWVWTINEYCEEPSGYLFVAKCNEYALLVPEEFSCRDDFDMQLCYMEEECSMNDDDYGFRVCKLGNCFSTLLDAELALAKIHE